MRRLLGIIFGVLTHLLFAVTVWQLFWFLQGSAHHQRGGLSIDLLLAAQFAVIHSLLLTPEARSSARALDFTGFLRIILLHGDLLEPGFSDDSVAERFGRRVAGDGAGGNGRRGGVWRVVGSSILQPAFKWTGLSNRLDAMALLASWRTGAAQAVSAAKRLSLHAASRLSLVSWPDLVCADSDARSRVAHRGVDGLRLRRELPERSPVAILFGPDVSRIPGSRAWLSRHDCRTTRARSVGRARRRRVRGHPMSPGEFNRRGSSCD